MTRELEGIGEQKQLKHKNTNAKWIEVDSSKYNFANIKQGRLCKRLG